MIAVPQAPPGGLCRAARMGLARHHDRMRQEDEPKRTRRAEGSIRYPAIMKACFHLNWLFLVSWSLYLLGPDGLGIAPIEPDHLPYRLFSGAFFLLHFVLVATAIIALFVVIIEVYSRRPVRGFRNVLVGLALPIASFLYFSLRYLAEVERWIERWR